MTIAVLAILAYGSTLRAQGRATLNGVVLGPTGAPQATVTLIVTNAQGIDRRAVSDAAGAFVFGGLQPGTYRLRTDDDTFAPFSQDAIVLEPGQALTIRIALQPRVPVTAPPTQRASVRGTVVGPEGQPTANVVLLIANADGVDRRVVSDANGAYVFGGLQPGTYRLRIEDPGPLARPFPPAELAFAPGEQRQFDIRLQPLPPPPPPPSPSPAAPPAASQPAPVAPKPSVPEPAAPSEAVAGAPAPSVTAPGGEFEAMPSRWGVKLPRYQRYPNASRMPFIVGGPLDPYNQNTAKGDFPIAGDSLFANVNLQLNSAVNPREVAAGRDVSTGQTFLNNNFVGGLEIFRGDTVFQPKSWAVRGTVVGNVSKVSTDDRRKQTYGVEEAFVEKRLAVISRAFDFISVRAGMQNFNSDFRGYLFVDNQLGVRLFGNARRNRDQYNVAYFSMRDRDAASQLHRFSSRDQDVLVANYYVQDFGVRGYTGMFNVHVNRDARVSDNPLTAQAGALAVTYLGFHGDGAWGRWAVSHAFYQAVGHDDDNRIARRLNGGSVAPVDIRAQMAAFELSRDADWRRYRVSAYYASGDDGARPGKARGFDTIADNPNLAGGQFMFWTQQNTKVSGAAGPLLVSEKFSLLPNLRSKFGDRANFVNPGLMLVNGGVDFRLSPALKVVTNVSYLRFADAAILRRLAGPGKGFEDDAIGWDAGVGAKYRPFVNENLFVVFGISTLMPRGGLATSLGSSSRLYSAVGAIQLAY